MSVADFVSVSYAIERELSTVSEFAKVTAFPIRSGEFIPTRNFDNANEARDDRFDTEDDLLSLDGNASFDRVWRPGVFDDFIAGGMFNSWVELNNRKNYLWKENAGNTALEAEITNVDGASATYTVTAGTAFAAGDLVFMTGFTNAANNGLKVTQTGSDGTTVIVSGVVVDETPPAGAEIKFVGRQFAAGDLALSGNVFTDSNASPYDFTALNLPAGIPIKIGGEGAAFQYDTAAVNDVVTVTSWSNGSFEVEDTLPNFAGDAGAGKTIRIFFAEYLVPGTTATTFTWQTVIPRKTGGDKIRRLVGQHPSEVRLSSRARDRFTLSCQMQGLGFKENLPDLRGAGEANLIRPRFRRSIRALDGGNRVFMDGTYVFRELAIRSSELTLNPNLLPVDVEGCESYLDMEASKQSAMLSGDCHFRSNVWHEKYEGNQTFKFRRVIPHGDGAYVADWARAQLIQLSDPIPESGNQVIVSYEFKATPDDAVKAAGGINPFFMMSRFPYADGFTQLC